MAVFPRLTFGAAVLAALATAGTLQAAGQIDRVEVSEQPGTLFRYDAGGESYAWGLGRNQVIEAVNSDGRRYAFGVGADRVELKRDDVPGVATGEPCAVFVESLAGSRTRFEANYPVDTSGAENCDTAALLKSRIVNRGALNLFSNRPPAPQNVERVDYLFDAGVLAPVDPDGLDLAGHVVGEKRGNNPVLMAAITALDVFGQPSEYGPLVRIGAHYDDCTDDRVCYGVSDLVHDYVWLQSASLAPQSFPTRFDASNESVAVAFVSARQLGLVAGQRYFGISLFPDDVDPDRDDLLDVSTFPDDTEDADILAGDDADIYGGVAGYYLADEASNASGAVFLDANGDGRPSDDEAGVAGLGLTLYADANGDGVIDPTTDAVVVAVETDTDGEFLLPALADGSYGLLLDKDDPEVPPGLSVAEGGNPLSFVVNGTDPEPLFFALTDGDPNGGSGDGGADGAGDSGGSDGGAGDSGGVDGGSDSGAGDSGGADGGADGAGDSGGADGGADGGGGDSGGADGGADGGAGDSGDADGGADGGAGDSGGADGGADGGAGDSGGADGGVDSGGGDDGGPVDDDDVTAAVDDTFTIRQDVASTLDVLANDTDASGDGLQIVGVGDSPSATIEIAENSLIYTPDYGFIGQDAFTYTIRDGDGTESTGNVSVTVERFSDINDDGLNDFDQCDCDNLTLETGVHGSGVGAGGALGAFLLALWYGRRVSRRPGREYDR